MITVNVIPVSASSKSNSLSVLLDTAFCTHTRHVGGKKTIEAAAAAEISVSRLTAVSMHRNTEELQYILHFKEIFLTTCVRCLASSVTVAVAVCACHLQLSASKFLRSSMEFWDLLGITK